jgi:hypothetical protein
MKLALIFLAVLFCIFLFIPRKRNTQGNKPVSGWEPIAVVGESFKNDDGLSRQKIIRKLNCGDIIQLIADPDNPYSDSGKAVAIFSAYGQIGYIGEDDEWQEAIFDKIAAGNTPSAKILNIYGGTKSKPHLGVVIEVDIQ